MMPFHLSFELNNSFHFPLQHDSSLPYVIFPFVNPFQPAICILSFNFPFTYDYIIVVTFLLNLINISSLFLTMIFS